MNDRGAIFWDEVPGYLRPIQNPTGEIHGTLSSSKTHWVVRAKPYVYEFAKRVFPGSFVHLGSKVLTFAKSQKTQADLCWLMQRFPLAVECLEEWKMAHLETARRAIRLAKEAVEPSRMTTDSSRFNGQLLPFQELGLAFIANNDRCLLADEMGLGKTVQALAWASEVRPFPLLIVAMPHIIRQWQAEIEKFLRVDETVPSVHVIRGFKPYLLPEVHVYLTHYLLLSKWKRQLADFGFRAVVFDEVQELRHSKSEKYSAASLLSSSVGRVVGLSGTPIYNRGGEIWNVMNAISYNCLGDWGGFTREWCYGFGSDVVAKPELLGEHLRREGLMLRRRKSEVMKELPPKSRLVQELDHDEKSYDQMIVPVVAMAGELLKVTDPFEKGRIERQLVSETRRATGIAKARFAAQFVSALLEAQERVLLFAHHHAVIDIYLEELKRHSPAVITGRQDQEEKARGVSDFMGGKTNLCVVSLRTMAGLNLERANCVVFGELDWSPAVHSQAEDRAHRKGQTATEPVMCYYLVCGEGTDAAMRDALGLKVSQFVGLMGDRIETEEDKVFSQNTGKEHMDRVIKALQEKASFKKRPT